MSGLFSHKTLIRINWTLLVILISITIATFFINPLFSYFSQDDFFHLRQVMDEKITNLPNLFMPAVNEEQTFYRPLSREFYNFVMLNTFGVWFFPYHLVNLLLVFINGALAYKLFKPFIKGRMVWVLAGIIYYTSQVHSVELYYLASVQTLISTAFILLSFLAYRRIYFFSILFFLLAIISHESSVVFIPIVLVFEILKEKLSPERIKKIIYKIIPFLVILGLRVVIYFYILGLPDQTSYKMSFLPTDILNTFIWFTLWCFGLPEMLTDFVTLRFQINPNLIRFYGDYVLFATILLMLIFLSLIIILVSLRKNILEQKLIFMVVLCYIISLTPFLFFPLHKFVYYLSFPVIWFSVCMGIILNIAWNKGRSYKFLVVLCLGAYILLSYKTIQLNKITYWAAKRAVAAEYIVNNIKILYPKVQKGTVFYIKNDPDYPFIAKDWGTSSKQAFYILSGSDALQLIYKDPTLRVYYEDVNASNMPKDKNSVNYTAKFPY